MKLDQLRKAVALIDELDEVLENIPHESDRMASIKHHADRLQEKLVAELSEQERDALGHYLNQATE